MYVNTAYNSDMNENDLRVRRSRRLLQEAFIELANNQSYADITIRRITQQAQVGYKTFFRHYESKEALLQAIVDSFVEEFEQSKLTHDQPQAVEKNTLAAFQLAQANSRLFFTIFNSPQSADLLKPVIEMAYRDSQQIFGASDVPQALAAHHFTSSMISLIKWWLENGMVYSAEEMVVYVNRLLLRPIK